MKKTLATITLLCLPPAGWIILAVMVLGKVGMFADD